MKSKTAKAAALLSVLLAIESVGFSQGYVSFFNSPSTRFSTNLFGIPAIAAAAPVGSYYFELLVAPSGTTATTPSVTNGTWVDTGVMGTNTATAGRMAGFTSSDGAGTQIPGYGPTAIANFAVLGWSANIGTFAQALSVWNGGEPQYGSFGFIGLSSVANDVALSPAGGPYNDVWGSATVGLIQGMVLSPNFPEPSSLALICLGALVMLRHRK